MNGCRLWVQGVVLDVLPYGCFVEFDVEVEEGRQQPVSGLVHLSELSWEFCEDARTIIKVGCCVSATV